MKSLLKVLLFNALFLGLIFISLEFYLGGDESKRRQEELTEKANSITAIDKEFMENIDSFLHSKAFQATPYLGVTYHTKVQQRTLLGHKKFPRKGIQDCFIGVFGGSLAEQLTQYLINQKVSPSFKVDSPCHQKKVTWINFAGGTFKQPYQLMAMALYIENLDIVVNLDGFNEVYLDPGIRFPSFFPYFTSEFYYPNEEKFKKLAEMKEAAFDGLKLKQFIKENPSLLKSALLSKFFSLLLKKKESIVSQSKRYLRQFQTYDQQWGIERTKNKIKEWKKFTAQQHAIAKLSNVPFLSALQPNLHYPNLKPLSTEELRLKELASNDKGYLAVKDSYGFLITAQNELRQREINTLDLTSSFKSISQTLYKDKCCHINNQGNELLAQVLISALQKF